MLEVGDRVRLKPPEELGDEFDVYSPENQQNYISLLNCVLTVEAVYSPSPDYFELRYGTVHVPFRIKENRVVKVNEEEDLQLEEEFQSMIF